jgi:SAM-dependent methyltransferase
VPTPYTGHFYDRHREGSSSSARVVVPLLREWVSPRSVVDVGCGVGGWLRAWRDAGVEDVLGLDGADVLSSGVELAVPRERFVPTDLARPLPVGRTFDLAMSLEVAEHLAPESAAGFVASLADLAPVILFSAAIPFQGGTGHRNEQWPAWWARRFATHGYRCYDVVRPAVWSDERVEPWYAQNTVLYVRDDGPRSRLRLPPGATHGSPAPLVHPWTYLRRVDPARVSARKALRLLFASLRARVARTPRTTVPAGAPDPSPLPALPGRLGA